MSDDFGGSISITQTRAGKPPVTFKYTFAGGDQIKVMDPNDPNKADQFKKKFDALLAEFGIQPEVKKI